MPRIMKIISMSGKVDKDIYGHWEDVDRGFWIGDDKVEPVLCTLLGKTVSVTIQEVSEDIEKE